VKNQILFESCCFFNASIIVQTVETREVTYTEATFNKRNTQKKSVRQLFFFVEYLFHFSRESDVDLCACVFVCIIWTPIYTTLEKKNHALVNHNNDKKKL